MALSTRPLTHTEALAKQNGPPVGGPFRVS
jgi:hypothetical protein